MRAQRVTRLEPALSPEPAAGTGAAAGGADTQPDNAPVANRPIARNFIPQLCGAATRSVWARYCRVTSATAPTSAAAA